MSYKIIRKKKKKTERVCYKLTAFPHDNIKYYGYMRILTYYYNISCTMATVDWLLARDMILYLHTCTPIITLFSTSRVNNNYYKNTGCEYSFCK